MELVSWNPVRMIRRHREGRQRLREEERGTVWNPVRMIRDHHRRREQRRVQLREQPQEQLREQCREQCREQLRIQLDEESRTVEISHPRTRIRGVFKIRRRYPYFKYVAFLSIPYAIPPVGKLRFQPPRALDQRPSGQPTPLFLAKEAYHPCAERSDNKYFGPEDCLYLSVYTPAKPENITGLLPVLVYIHGGCFAGGGNNEELDLDDIMREDLIVVIINYRLGLFGFLNMRTENCLGNAGLKDQVMALRWVRDNIEQFKGNPQNVTICGHSDGGTCVNLHMISPLSKGLFHKAIVMGGGIYSPWGVGGHSKHVKQLFNKAVGRPNELRQVLVDILKTGKTFDLLKMGKGTTAEYMSLIPRMTVFVKPSVEFIKEDAFLPDTVENLMAIAKPVPTIAGITKEEGYHLFRVNKTAVWKLMKKKNKFIEPLKKFIQQNFGWKDPNAVERHFEFFMATYFESRYYYFTEEDDIYYTPVTLKGIQMEKERKRIKEEKRKNCFAKLVTDIYFRRFYDNFKIGNLLSDNNWPPFYVYELDYFAKKPIFLMPKLKDDQRIFQPLITPEASEHGDDLILLLGPQHIENAFPITIREGYIYVTIAQLDIGHIQINMRNLWSSFCRTGETYKCVSRNLCLIEEGRALSRSRVISLNTQNDMGYTLISHSEIPKTELRWDAHVNWLCHTEEDPHYLHIGRIITLKYKRLNEERWSELNRICQLESTISPLAVTPQTPEKECKKFQLLQPKPGPSTTHAPDTPCTSKKFQLLQPKPGPSTTQAPDTPYTSRKFQLSQPKLN